MAGERILLVEDRVATREMMREALEEAGYAVCEAGDLGEAEDKLHTVEFDAVVSDLRLPRGTGLDVLERVRAASEETPVILITAYGTVATAVEAMRKGVFDFLTKPFELDHLFLILERSLERRRLMNRHRALRVQDEANSGAPPIVGDSSPFRGAYQEVVQVAPKEATVLLLGESGTGKELFAQAVHRLSPRSGGPWVAINCAALPRELVESELFGAEKGAFTGASQRRQGKIELAHRGTLFLDEVGELDPGSQAKLLRVLEEKCFTRLGGSRTVHVDIRLVAASNRDLCQAVAEKAFRSDLYYRLKVFPVRIPPLRERSGDISLLAEHFIAHFAREMKRPLPELAPEVVRLLEEYAWPGNVRELRNAIERAMILSEESRLDLRHFELGQPAAAAGSPLSGEGEGWPALKDASRQAAEEVEVKLIRDTLTATGGNKSRAAELLGVSYKTLWSKVRDYDL